MYAPKMIETVFKKSTLFIIKCYLRIEVEFILPQPDFRKYLKTSKTFSTLHRFCNTFQYEDRKVWHLTYLNIYV